jgi:polyisoprenoid-binding protein YceI
MTSVTTPFAGSYAADPVHSNFGFAVRYQGVSLYKGMFDDVNATLADGRLEGVAKVESISIRSPEQFRAHVLSGEFFDAENHPEITFTSSSVELAEDGTATVDGEITIKGITRPVHATGTWTAPQADAWNNSRGYLNLDATIDRTDFDIKWNIPLPSGENALANEVKLTVELWLVEQQG